MDPTAARAVWLAVLLALTPVATAAQAPPRTAADSAWARGDMAAAERLYAQRLAADSADAVALRRLAVLAGRAGRHRESIALYDRFLRIHPEDGEAEVERARVLGWARDYAAATAAYARILRATPGDRGALLGLAQILSWSGRTDSATVILHRLLETDPDDSEALKWLARAVGWGGDLRLAEEHWRRILRVAPDDAEALAGLSANLRWQGRDAAAFRAAQQAEALAPHDTEVGLQWRHARAAVAPRVAPVYTYEADSDGNRMETVAGTAAWRPRPQVEIRATGHWRALRGPDMAGGSAELAAFGALVEGYVQTDDGWSLQGAVGASSVDLAGARSVAAFRAAVSSPRWLPATGTVSYAREAFDATAVLALRRIRTQRVAAEGSVRLAPRVSLVGGVAFTGYRGTEDNRQTAAKLGALWRLRDPVAVGVGGRAFWFRKDRLRLPDGYFNPDFFGIAEATITAYREVGKWALTAEAVPGWQQVGSDGDPRASLRTTGRVVYLFQPGRQVGVSAGWANSGVEQLTPADDRAYRYKAFSVFSNWAF